MIGSTFSQQYDPINFDNIVNTYSESKQQSSSNLGHRDKYRDIKIESREQEAVSKNSRVLKENKNSKIRTNDLINSKVNLKLENNDVFIQNSQSTK